MRGSVVVRVCEIEWKRRFERYVTVGGRPSERTGDARQAPAAPRPLRRPTTKFRTPYAPCPLRPARRSRGRPPHRGRRVPGRQSRQGGAPRVLEHTRTKVVTSNWRENSMYSHNKLGSGRRNVCVLCECLVYPFDTGLLVLTTIFVG